MVIQTAGGFFWRGSFAFWGSMTVRHSHMTSHGQAPRPWVSLWSTSQGLSLGSNFWRHPLGMSQNNYFEHVAPYHLIPVGVQYIFPTSALQSSWKTLLFHQDVRGCSFSNEPWQNIDIAEFFLHCILIHPTSQSALTDQEPLEILINENTPGKVSLLEIPARYMFL